MNRKQRMKNRDTSAWLRNHGHICIECGERGLHFIAEPMSLADVLDGHFVHEPRGFWTCAKFYGPDGKRLPEHTDRDPVRDVLLLAAAVGQMDNGKETSEEQKT